jgi:Histidine kinase-, DNA gyrase B-, and HSP90-like ATPase
MATRGKDKAIDEIRRTVLAGRHAWTKLATDQRVLTRVTYGIYRQPASALRELIFNAYDADATEVWINTDSPRFSQIVVQDNGQGMTLDVLNRLIRHIGGSAKRTKEGIKLGVTSRENDKLSPRGRKLIGKIGIGLFAVAQLTRHFQIITKPVGENYRYVADIRLGVFDEEAVESEDSSPDLKQEYETGDVEIWRETADPAEQSGTKILLLELRDYARSLLQSREMWAKMREDAPEDERGVAFEPTFHIGAVSPDDPSKIDISAVYPWSDDVMSPPKRFRKFYQSVLDQVNVSHGNPTLEETFDNYFRMVWTLALSAPVDYVDKHPFDLTADDGVRVFLLSNKDRESAREIELKGKRTVGQAANVHRPSKPIPFHVYVDGLELLRPIKFRDLPFAEKSSQTTPLLFVARCVPSGHGRSPVPGATGGPLAFDGYFFWTTKVIPKENTGIILRIGDASGTLFDDTFLNYEVSEQTRLRQTTAELFVSEGLDSALNIDRESFNYSHPHYQFLSRWVHRALRQLATRHKAIGDDMAIAAREERVERHQERLSGLVEEILVSAPGSPEPSAVVFMEDERSEEAQKSRRKGTLVFPSAILPSFPAVKGNKRQKAKANTEKIKFEGKLKAVAQILDGYGLLNRLSYSQQARILDAIARVFAQGDEA